MRKPRWQIPRNGRMGLQRSHVIVAIRETATSNAAPTQRDCCIQVLEPKDEKYAQFCIEFIWNLKPAHLDRPRAQSIVLDLGISIIRRLQVIVDIHCRVLRSQFLGQAIAIAITSHYVILLALNYPNACALQDDGRNESSKSLIQPECASNQALREVQTPW